MFSKYKKQASKPKAAAAAKAKGDVNAAPAAKADGSKSPPLVNLPTDPTDPNSTLITEKELQLAAPAAANRLQQQTMRSRTCSTSSDRTNRCRRVRCCSTTSRDR